MKNSTKFLLNQYSKMSVDKKVRLGLSLSATIRKIREQGKDYKKQTNINLS